MIWKEDFNEEELKEFIRDSKFDELREEDLVEYLTGGEE